MSITIKAKHFWVEKNGNVNMSNEEIRPKIVKTTTRKKRTVWYKQKARRFKTAKYAFLFLVIVVCFGNNFLAAKKEQNISFPHSFVVHAKCILFVIIIFAFRSHMNCLICQLAFLFIEISRTITSLIRNISFGLWLIILLWFLSIKKKKQKQN